MKPKSSLPRILELAKSLHPEGLGKSSDEEVANEQIMDRETFTRLRASVGEFYLAKEYLDEFELDWLLRDIRFARRKLRAGDVFLSLGASDSGFMLGQDRPHASAFEFIFQIDSIIDALVINRGPYLLDDSITFDDVNKSQLDYFRGGVSAFGHPSEFDLRQIHLNLEKEISAVQLIRKRYGSWVELDSNSNRSEGVVLTAR
jgi:hypothetical protein